MENNFKKFDEIFSSEKSFRNLRNAINAQEAVDKFFDVFPELAKVVVPVKNERQILYLRVDNSVWRSELNFRKELIVNKINIYFKKELVKGIKFI